MSIADRIEVADEPVRVCGIDGQGLKIGKVSGGIIGDFVEGVHEYDCEMVLSPIKGVDFAMTVIGDSMMPEYYPGDRILIKGIDPNLFIEWGKVYVLDTPNGAVLKKVNATDDPGAVECVSLNPAYQSFTIPVNAIRGWYRVMMVMSMK